MMALRRSARLNTALNNKVLPPQPRSPPKKSSRPQSSNRVNKAKSRSRKDVNDLKISVEQLPLDVTLPDSGAIPVSNNNVETVNTLDLISTDPPSRLHATPPPLDRPVEPHRTNATLLTPHGSSLVAYPPGSESLSPLQDRSTPSDRYDRYPPRESRSTSNCYRRAPGAAYKATSVSSIFS